MNYLNKKPIIGAVNGCFDIFHIGHLKLLEFAASRCDYLVVAINSDKYVRKIKGKTRPINNEKDRMDLLCHINCVDKVILVNEDNMVNFLLEIRPDIWIKGEEYKIIKNKLNIDELNALNSYGGKILFAPMFRGLSSTNILNKI